jgi:tRNA (adenine22-N1)-methyltransferase
VGADHGQLICALVASGKCPRGFAADIAVGPLDAARRTIREAGLEDRVRAVLSDGLKELPGEEIDDVVIAGMGGELIAEILLAVPWTRDGQKRFVLQPMTREATLRRTLYREGFAILAEQAVISGRFVYPLLTAHYTGEPSEITPLFAETGLLLGKNDPVSRRYLEKVRSRLVTRLAGLEAAGEIGEEVCELRDMVGQLRETET